MLLDFSWSPLAKPLDSAVVWSGILSGIGGGFVEICRNHWSDIISCIRSKTMWRAMFLVACVSVGRCQLGFSHWLFPRALSVFFSYLLSLAVLQPAVSHLCWFHSIPDMAILIYTLLLFFLCIMFSCWFCLMDIPIAFIFARMKSTALQMFVILHSLYVYAILSNINGIGKLLSW